MISINQHGTYKTVVFLVY